MLSQPQTAGMIDVGQGEHGALTIGNSIVGHDDHGLSLDNETSMLCTVIIMIRGYGIFIQTGCEY